MNQREHREQALARAQAATWALSEASQALIDARRASETAGDWIAYGRDLDMLLTRLWPIREALESTRNKMRDDPSLDSPLDPMSAGDVEHESPFRCTRCGADTSGFVLLAGAEELCMNCKPSAGEVSPDE